MSKPKRILIAKESKVECVVIGNIIEDPGIMEIPGNEWMKPIYARIMARRKKAN